MHIEPSFDFSELESIYYKIFEYQQKKLLVRTARVVMMEILAKTGRGTDADNVPFQSAYSFSEAYVPAYQKVRKRHELQITNKTLEFAGDMMNSLEYYDGEQMVSVGEKFQKIAKGQMEGSPKWKQPYRLAKFLMVGDDSYPKIVEVVENDISEIIQ